MVIDLFTSYLHISLPCDSWLLLTSRHSHPFKGTVSRYSVIFVLFFARAKNGTARASVADIRPWQLGQLRKQLQITAQAEWIKCRFSWAYVIFRGLALWLPLFFPTQNGCQKITDIMIFTDWLRGTVLNKTYLPGGEVERVTTQQMQEFVRNSKFHGSGPIIRLLLAPKPSCCGFLVQ